MSVIQGVTQIQKDLWRQRSLWLALVFSICLWSFYPTFAQMVSIWWNASTFNHCFLIPVISLYLIYEKRKTLAAMLPEISSRGLVFVFLSSLLWLIGELISVSVFQHLAVVSLIIGVTWSLLGNQIASLLMFPLAYLYFSVPEGEFIVPYLMDWTAWVTVKLLRLTGIPVFLEGLYISIPSGNFVVAEACSGINYLIASLSLCTVFAYLNYQSWNRRLFFMLLALIVPLLANGLRAYGIVMIAHLSDMKYATGVDHIIYGWFFFGIVIFILFYLGGLFSEHPSESETVANTLSNNDSKSGIGVVGIALLTVALALSGQGLLYVMDSTRNIPGSLAIPAATDGWTGPEQATKILQGVYKGVGQYETVEYRHGADSVYLDVAYYAQEQQGQELISSVNRVYSAQSWKRIEEQLIHNEVLGTDIKEYVLRRAGSDYLLWYWYDLHGHATVSALKSKIYQGLARATGDDTGAAAFSVYTQMTEGREAAESRLKQFVAAIRPSLETMQKSD